MNIKKTRKPLYSLHKSRSILKWIYSWYKKQGSSLPSFEISSLEKSMTDLDQALLQKNREEATQIAERLKQFGEAHCKKSVFEYTRELVFALIFALVIATLVRQMWFEPYEIPTGSMRPTFREQDHLTVTKTAFGINYPLETKHLYFDPSLVQRSSVLIFSGDGMAMSDVDTTYFGIFPYKKRFIKRCIGKPGDAIYFYGGRLYGVDKEGNDLTELRDSPWMQALEYVPFLSFEGVPSLSAPQTVLLKQMHNPTGKIFFSSTGQIQGEVFNGKTWIKDNPLAQTEPHSTIQTYSDLYGMRNYAEARLLTQEELRQLVPNADTIAPGVLYLQLHHTPSLSFPRPVTTGNYLGITGYSTVIPLQQQHLDRMMDALYTARFVVLGGKARRYSLENPHFSSSSPAFPDVPDGTYEFYFGQATKIHWGGIATSVPQDSSLYSHDPKNVQRLFNMGIEMDTTFSPSLQNEARFPHRYAYFRDGDLYLMGAPILAKEDPTLIAFKQSEEKRQAQAASKTPYVAFKDYGSPMKEGKIDVDFVRTFGVKVPDLHYLVLGDNHAMSSDSRIFGTVPQNNLQGAPYWIIWPPGDRLGAPPQKNYPFMNTPRAIVWACVGFIALCWYAFRRWEMKRPVFVSKCR